MACCKKAAPAEIKEKTPAQKAVDTRRKNIIAEQKEMLDKSTSAAAHKQWITKKNNEISAKDEKTEQYSNYTSLKKEREKFSANSLSDAINYFSHETLYNEDCDDFIKLHTFECTPPAVF